MKLSTGAVKGKNETTKNYKINYNLIRRNVYKNSPWLSYYLNVLGKILKLQKEATVSNVYSEKDD